MKDSDKKNWRDSFLVRQSLGQSAGMVPRRDKIAVSFASRYVMHEEQKRKGGKLWCSSKSCVSETITTRYKTLKS